MTVAATVASPGPRGHGLMLVSAVIAFVIVMLLALTVIAILLVNARLVTRQEVAAAFDLASSYVDGHRSQLVTSADPLVVAVALASQIDRLRHVRAILVDPDGAVTFEMPVSSDVHPAPDWFVRMIGGRTPVKDITITKYPNVLGKLRITGDYRDKGGEVWRDFSNIVPTIAAACLLAVATSCGIVLLIVRWIRQCEAALDGIRAGEYSIRLPRHPIAEFTELAGGINDLARHLRSQRNENELLQRRLMTLTETERQQIASDLHDGMGPYLFALGAALSEARGIAADWPEPDRARMLTALSSIGNHLRGLRKSTRMAIYHLRPLMHREGSLSDLLNEFAAEFCTVAPGVRVSFDVEPSAEQIHRERVDLVVYRFVQESALNAVRHGGATVVAITVWQEREPVPELVVRLSDNGSGPAPDARPRHGQTGIIDRVRTLGGRYHPPFVAEEGIRTEIRIPC